MKVIQRNQLLLVLAFAAACIEPVRDESRESVAFALRENLGELADPQVGFLSDSTHLRVALATVAFPTVSDSVLTEQARRIGGFTFSHYEKANQLDSVTVLFREAVRPGIWHIRHTRTFPIDSLRTRR